MSLNPEVHARPDDLRIGTFAEFMAVKEDSEALQPRNIGMDESTSIPLVGLPANCSHAVPARSTPLQVTRPP